MTIVEISAYQLLKEQKTLIRLKDGLVDKGLKDGILVPGKLVKVQFECIELVKPFCLHVLDSCNERGISATVIAYDLDCDSLHAFIQQLSECTQTRILLLMSTKDGNINLIKRKINLILHDIFSAGNTCVISNLDMIDQLPDQGIVVSENFETPQVFDVKAAKFKSHTRITLPLYLQIFGFVQYDMHFNELQNAKSRIFFKTQTWW